MRKVLLQSIGRFYLGLLLFTALAGCSKGNEVGTRTDAASSVLSGSDLVPDATTGIQSGAVFQELNAKPQYQLTSADWSLLKDESVLTEAEIAELNQALKF